MERRYLIVPGITSSRMHILDTKSAPRQPKIVRVIEPEEVAQRSGYAAPHTVHCGPEGVYVSALGAPDGDGPGGTFMLDPETFDIRGPWEIDRGPQHLAYDVWWHLGQDTMITSTWGTPNMVKDGVDPELLLSGKYGHKLHVWDLRRRRHVQELDLGAEQQMALELRPAHDPTRAYGFVGVVLSLKDLSSSIWLWYREPHTERSNGANGAWAIKKVIDIPAQPADPEQLPPILQGFEAVAPLVTDINLSVDDRYLYVSCWGTGEFIQYDVSDPFHPRKLSSIHLGGIVTRAAHPGRPGERLNGGPQMDQPRRKTHLLLEWPVYPVGRTVLSRRHSRLDGEGRCRPRRDDARSRVLPDDRRHAHPSGSAAGRRCILGLVLLRLRARVSLDWSALLLLGAYHGLNPSMGWLFAVALGMQHGNVRGVYRAFPPIALGHIGSVAMVLLIAAAVQIDQSFSALGWSWKKPAATTPRRSSHAWAERSRPLSSWGYRVAYGTGGPLTRTWRAALELHEYDSG